MKLSLIVAMSRNQVIGHAGRLPWRLSDDLKRFKRLTMGHPIIMGRKTFESIGKALPGRTSIVITRQKDFRPAGVRVASSLSQAIQLAQDNEEAFVVGGAQVYAEALPRVDRIYVTLVETDVEGDTLFPDWNPRDWRLIEQAFHPADDKNEFDHHFRVYDRM